MSELFWWLVGLWRWLRLAGPAEMGCEWCGLEDEAFWDWDFVWIPKADYGVIHSAKGMILCPRCGHRHPYSDSSD